MPNKIIYTEQRGSSAGTEHNKFYEFEDDGTRVIFRWGDIGRYPTVKGKDSGSGVKVALTSDDPAARDACLQKKFKEKTAPKHHGGPYVVIRQDAQVIESRPDNTGRGWGLEVETHSRLSVNEVVAKMRERGLKVSVRLGDYFHSDGKNWDVKRDGSCGFEFASPILHAEAGIFDAKIAVEKIREVCQTAVNTNCGIHVTVDVSDFSKQELKRLVIAYLKAQEHFYSKCNESRQDNQYCRRNPTNLLGAILTIDASNIQLIVDKAGGWRNHSDRYHGLNFTRLFSKKVVEFRMLESSVSVRKVGAWVRMCVGFIDGVKNTTIAPTTEPMTSARFNEISGQFDENEEE
jgi:hypothetical protein